MFPPVGLVLVLMISAELKIFIALLSDDARLELRAPNPDADDPTTRLGVRLKPRPVPRSDREELVGGYG